MANRKKTELTPSERWGAEIGYADQVAEKALARSEYDAFLDGKSQLGDMCGFDPIWMPSGLFGFQEFLSDWSIRKGRCAELTDCGTGKTAMQLTWGENVVRHTNKPVLDITPLAVGSQTVREGEKFGIECRKAEPGKITDPCIYVTNYERLHQFDPDDFAGVILDESSILKSFDGTRRSQITEFMRTRKYRLLCTATAAPNDYIELGTSSEALGELGYLDMLNRFFKNDQGTIKPMRYTGFGAPRSTPQEHTDKWRFKGHAEVPFWRWVCSWARAMRRPSDLGFPDDGFTLPELIERQHLVTAATIAEGMLFSVPAVGLKEQRDERRRTIQERCEKVADLVAAHDQSLIWCHLNDEGDLLEEIVPDAVQVSGSDRDEVKEERLLAFATGQIKRLVTKQKIAGWGMNWQNCAHMTTFPSHSFEQYYQGVRRCWRFGQKRPVMVDIVTTEGEQAVLENLQRKASAADKIFSALVEQMANAIKVERSVSYPAKERVPKWL